MDCASVTHLGDRLAILEGKETLINSDYATVKCLIKKMKALDDDFKEHHYTNIDLIGKDGETQYEEQAVMDDHEDKVVEITQHLQKFWQE